MLYLRWIRRASRSPRACYNLGGALGSIIGLVPTLFAASHPSSTFRLGSHEALGAVVVAFWAVVPPMFFWLDWVYFCRKMKFDAPERDVAIHTHDLSRNIWLGLVFALSLIFFKSVT
jgi:hypothetical protein